MNPTDLLQEKHMEIVALCRKYAVKRLWVFGSAVTGKFDPESSDVDFLVEYRPGTSLGPWLKDYFEFKDALESLLGRSVDLVMEGASKNPYFIRNVQGERRELFAA